MTSGVINQMMLPRRKSRILTLAGVFAILALFVLAAPVSAATVSPSPAGDRVLPPATGNASAAAEPMRRNGDFVFWVSSETDVSAAAATIRAVTPRPIGPNGIIVESLMPGFAWAPVLGATEYRLDVYADPGLSQTVTSVTTPVPAAAITVPLEAGGDYYWTVRVTQPDESGRSWASFNVSPQATALVVQVTTAAASRPRAANSVATNMIPQPATLSFEADATVPPEPIVINLPAAGTADAGARYGVLPVVIVIGLLLVIGVLTLLLRPYLSD